MLINISANTNKNRRSAGVNVLPFLYYLVAILFLTACDDGAVSRNDNRSCVAPAQVTNPNIDIQLTPAFPNLPALPYMVALNQAPGDTSRWFATLKDGRVVVFDNHPDVDEYEVILDIRDRVRNLGEMGLHAIAFHPSYPINSRLFVSYNHDGNGDSIISSFNYDGVNSVNTNNETIILTQAQPAGNHNGGQIAFGPDGMLYIALGDGGGGGDPYGNGQNLETKLGAILRINVDGNAPYTVPNDNPFIDTPNAAPEIFAYGLRNTWRFSFDLQTGELWAADVGQNQFEEINIIESGDNLGWPIMEASSCYGASSCDQSGLKLPVAEYSHDDGDCSVSGGYVYRGSTNPALTGTYLYTDYCSGKLRSTRRVADTYVSEVLFPSNINSAGMAQDLNGEVYYLGFGGSNSGIAQVYKIEATSDGDTSAIPSKLSETGCFQDTSTQQVNEHVVPFAVKSALWSDGAAKSRFLALPKGKKITLSESGDYLFPVGSVLIKHFLAGDQYLETRLLMRHQTGWGGYSYEWNAAQTDADLIETGKVIDAGEFQHTIPTPSQCFECHTSAANVALGPEASQLNSTLVYPSGKESNQNSALVKAGYLESTPTAAQLSDMAAIEDQSASLELRARSYLHANCSGCHRPGGPASHMDMRIQTAFADMGLCNEVPSNGDMDIFNARLIAPGDPSRSILLARMEDLGDYRMPPLASLRVDDMAVDVVSGWIASLSQCPE